VGDLDYQIPFGTARIVRAGSEVTVLSYLSMVAKSLEAIERTGMDGELIDLRFLDQASVDWACNRSECHKDQRGDDCRAGSRGAPPTVAGSLTRFSAAIFDHLDQPVHASQRREASPSISKVLEAAAIAESTRSSRPSNRLE
jgi:2-oxoisovalerate dehydrogenase E1 component